MRERGEEEWENLSQIYKKGNGVLDGIMKIRKDMLI